MESEKAGEGIGGRIGLFISKLLNLEASDDLKSATDFLCASLAAGLFCCSTLPDGEAGMDLLRLKVEAGPNRWEIRKELVLGGSE